MLLESVLLETLLQTTRDTIIHEFSKQGYTAIVSGSRDAKQLVFNISVPSVQFEHTLTISLKTPLHKWIEMCCPSKKRNYSVQLDVVALRNLIRTLDI